MLRACKQPLVGRNDTKSGCVGDYILYQVCNFSLQFIPILHFVLGLQSAVCGLQSSDYTDRLHYFYSIYAYLGFLVSFS